VAAVIRHALSEGMAVLRERAAVSIVLTLALAVPIALAAVGLDIYLWLDPVAEDAAGTSTVAVLLHPRLGPEERSRWIVERSREHTEWAVVEVSSDDVAERLRRWFPYLRDLLETGDASLPPLIEISTTDPSSVETLQGRPEILAIGPRSSIQQTLGRVARRLAGIIAGVSGVLLAGAFLLASVWVHLELYRHGDEITIMRLVGATEGTIRGPFLFAVVVPGLVAGAVAALASTATVGGLSRLTISLGLSAISTPPVVVVLQIVVGGLLPLVASTITLARHANEEIEG
jgi:cell division transport system permease protein